MPTTAPLLSLAIWVPIAFGLGVLAAGNDKDAPVQRWLALVGAITGFLVTIPLWTGFDVKSASICPRLSDPTGRSGWMRARYRASSA